MKKLLLALSLGATIAATAAAADTKKIVYASYLSPQHITNPVMQEYFAAVTEQTGGSVTFESHVGGALLSGRDIPGGVRDGLADAGYFVGSYIPSEMPVDNFIAEFSLWNDEPLVMTGVLNELVLFKCPECVEEYAKFNTQFLATYALTPYVYHCRSELSTLADFSGKRVRGIAAYADLARALNAAPVNVSPDEAYEALDRGVIDCALHSIAAQKARSYGEAAKFVILDPLGGFLGASTFNLRFDKWNELTVEERDAIRDNLAAMVTSAIFNYIKEDEDVIEAYTKSGTKFYNAAPEFAAKIEDFKSTYLPTVLEKGKTLGVKDPEAIANAITELTDKWRKLLEENGSDRETFQRLLHEEIFSKIDTSAERG
ncbi:MAG: C4-dicarboxylate TRAP transporter substrate-binding protein [Aquamicrobium sp.]|nr:C4-dicarboxylate TRAP transporter substrate-binding protein [Aquamicrobium sp.]